MVQMTLPINDVPYPGAAFPAGDVAAVLGGDHPEDKFTDKKQSTYKKIFSTISRTVKL